jgi:hypothetical protein
LPEEYEQRRKLIRHSKYRLKSVRNTVLLTQEYSQETSFKGDLSAPNIELEKLAEPLQEEKGESIVFHFVSSPVVAQEEKKNLIAANIWFLRVAILVAGIIVASLLFAYGFIFLST